MMQRNHEWAGCIVVFVICRLLQRELPALMLTLSLMILSSGVLPLASAQDKVGPEVYDALQKGRAVPVMIALQPPASLKAPLRRQLASVRNDLATMQADVLAHLHPAEYAMRHEYEVVPALAGTVTRDALAKLAAHPNVLKIDLDVGGSGALDTSVRLVKADKMHSVGITGQGVVVAVLDSGLDTDHADLIADLVGQKCFLDNDGSIDGRGRCPNGSDRQRGSGAAEDDQGHGTNVTGIITSNGRISPKGVAPDARILAYKVLDNNNRFYFFSEIVAALDDIIANHPEVKIINMSLATAMLFNGNCDNDTAFTMAGAVAINLLRANGVITFAASGNNSSGTQMNAPACLSNVVSVGATDDNDNVAFFTNSNPTTDVMAPGVDITSTGLANGISTFFGTSTAAPHAAGCAALFMSAKIATSPNEIEGLLKSSSVKVTDTKNGLEFPRIDCNQLEVVNGLVNLAPITSTSKTVLDPSGCPPGFIGKFSFDARLTSKTSSPPISNAGLKVITLTNENLLQNADGAPGGVGSILPIPGTGGYSDGVLSADESVDVTCIICLKDRIPFQFFVDVLGVVNGVP